VALSPLPLLLLSYLLLWAYNHFLYQRHLLIIHPMIAPVGEPEDEDKYKYKPCLSETIDCPESNKGWDKIYPKCCIDPFFHASTNHREEEDDPADGFTDFYFPSKPCCSYAEIIKHLDWIRTICHEDGKEWRDADDESGDPVGDLYFFWNSFHTRKNIRV